MPVLNSGRRARTIQVLLALALLVVPMLAVNVPGVGAQSRAPEDTIRFKVKNNTGQVLSPPAIIAAPSGWAPFMPGQPASAELEALAENGDNSLIVEWAANNGADVAFGSTDAWNPGQTLVYEIDAPVLDVTFWVMAMAVWTNDGFFVAHAQRAPGKLSDFVVQAQLMDAGTEVNSEAASDVPGLGGMAGEDEHGVVHPHAGLQGVGDVDAEIYSLDGGAWVTLRRASTRENPGQTPQLATYRITIANHTSGQGFSPPVIAVNPEPVHPFMLGAAASAGVQNVAENGDNSVLAEEWMNAGVQTVIVLSELVLPGTSTTVEFEAPKNGYVSWCSMLGVTNDGFTCAMDALPKKLQTTGGDGYAYDAGTEVNTETAADVLGLGGMGHTDENGVVQQHAGVVGDADLDPATHGWDGAVSYFSVIRD